MKEVKDYTEAEGQEKIDALLTERKRLTEKYKHTDGTSIQIVLVSIDQELESFGIYPGQLNTPNP